jgi:hypothetical protein
MNRQELVHGFDFHNEGVFDQEVNDVPLCDLHSLLFQRQDFLAAVRDPSELQFVAQAGVITGFQQAWTEMAMYLNCGPKCLLASCIGGVLDESHGASRKSQHGNRS